MGLFRELNLGTKSRNAAHHEEEKEKQNDRNLLFHTALDLGGPEAFAQEKASPHGPLVEEMVHLRTHKTEKAHPVDQPPVHFRAWRRVALCCIAELDSAGRRKFGSATSRLGDGLARFA